MLMRHTTGCLIAILAVSGCGSGELIDNPMIDRWCGDRPCAWEVSGRVQRVGTWHTDDYAVELLGRNTTLSQRNATVDADQATCLGFSMIADVSRSAKLFVELDFLDDGVVDFSQQMPETHWERRTFLIATPSWYEGVRFIVRKSGSGRAVLAELRAYSTTGCKREPVELLNRPDGVRCEEDAQCESSRCRSGRCSYCQGNLQCSASTICGLAFANGTVAERCVRRSSARFGEPCSSDAQCSTGVCCGSVCSQCCPDGVDCKDDATCARGEPISKPEGVVLPFQCAPGEESASRGGACVAPQDCQSRSCSGATFMCADCPGADDDAGVADDGLPCALTCSQWTFRGGTCD